MANIKSLADLGGSDGGGSESDDGRDGFNDYYAGGEKSGQLIRGAPKKDEEEADADEIAALFEKAKRSGAVQGSAEDLRAGNRAFQGTGRTLTGSATQGAQAPLVYTITFYRNNVFTVNDGPPRSAADPANRAFIEAIEDGVCPEELEPPVRGTPITVNLMRKEEDYQPPAKPRQAAAFQGTGRTLASGAGEASGSGSSALAVPAPAPESLAGEWEGVNEALPTTSLQLRLADGSRLVARFNHSHHVSDIRRFIRAARPDITWAYTLMSGVPPAPISEGSDPTLEAAGLLNSVVIQKKQ